MHRILIADSLDPAGLALLTASGAEVVTLAEADRPRLAEIAGTVPSLRELIPGCAFADRCFAATDICRREPPPFEEKAPGHFAACFHSGRLAGE